MESLLEDIRSGDPDKLREVLKAMTWLAIVQKGSEELHQAIEALHVDHSDLEISGRSLQLLQQLLPESTSKVLHMLPILITKLGSSHSIISRTAFNCIALAAKARPQEVMQSLTEGLNSKNSRIKTQCLRGLGLLSGYVDASVIEKILELMKDPNLSATALSTVKRLINASEKLKRSLSKEILHTIEHGVPPSQPSISPRRSEGLRALDPDFVEQMMESPNWKEKLQALEELDERFESIQNLQVAQIYKFLIKLLVDNNFRIVNGSLLLIEKLISAKGLQTDPEALLRDCLIKLGDDRISYRLNSFKILRLLMKEISPDFIFPFILDSLTSLNWHLREGCLNVIMAAILDKKTKYSYETLVPHVLPLLHDPKAKVRFVAIETLAVIASSVGAQTVLKNAITDEVLQERLKARFRRKEIATLKEDWIELPKLTPGSAPLKQSGHPKFDSPIAMNVNLPLAEVTVSPPTLRTNTKRPRRGPGVVIKSFAQETPDFPAPVKALNASYMGKMELEPVDNPEAELHKVMGANPQQWAEQFEIMNVIRRLLSHHPGVFAGVNLRSLIFQILKWADSLRSALSKNALIVTGELCSNLSKQVEPELEQILSTLLRKSTDTNVFIAEEAEKALVIVCTTCTGNRVVSILIQIVSATRSSLIKSKVAICIFHVFSKKQNEVRKLKDLDNLIQVLANLIREASMDVRKNAKSAFSELSIILSQDFNSMLKRALPSAQLAKVQEILTKSDTENSPKKLARSFEIPARPKPAQVDPAEAIRHELHNEDWISRIEALSKLKEVLLKSKVLTSKGVHCLIAGLNDTDPRVSMHTLSIISKVVPSVTNSPDLSPVLPNIIGLLNSVNTLLRNNAKDVCRLLVSHSDQVKFLPTLIDSLQRPKDRAWLFLFTLLIESLASVKTPLLHKYVIPFAKNLAQKHVTGTAKKFIDRLDEVVEDLPGIMGNLWENCN